MVALSLAPARADADDLTRHLRRRADGSQRFEIAVRGAHCAGCLAKIEKGVRDLDGVREARLNLSTGRLTVALDDKVLSPHAVLKRVRDLGYDANPFEAGAARDTSDREGRTLLHCLAVAAFGTVFTMGLTDAVWYGGGDMSVGLRRAFFWLAAAVAVPVTLYAGQPFFRSALAAIGKGRANMDVPIGLALILSLGLSLYQTAHGGAETYFDAAAMLSFLLLVGRYLDYRLRERAHGAARHLLSLQALLARRLRPDGTLETVAARDLQPGERILLASGERVPVDGRLAEQGTEADLSLVTGESLPQSVPAGTMLRAGAIVTGPPAVLLVSERVDDSLVADLARLLEAGQQSRSVYVTLAQRAARAYVPGVIGLALLVWAGWMLQGAAFSIAVTNAITILIITCPCALGLAVPAVQVAATSRLFRRGLFVKSGNALERLASVDLAVFDKTGTLTLGTPVLVQADRVPSAVLERAAQLARSSRHPFAQALAAAAGEGPVAAPVEEVTGAGLRCADQRMLGSRVFVTGDGTCADTSELWFREGDAPPVRFAFEDRLRPQTNALLAGLRERGIAVEMLTGDSAAPAARIAREAGIDHWFAASGPREKADHLQWLREQGRRVLMVGDGLNDAGAMALAQVSVAPGSATDISQLAADMVIRGDSLLPLAEAIDVARKARRLVLENFALAVLYNLTAIPLAVTGLVTPLIAAATMAGSSLLVTLNALRLAGRP